MAYEPLHHKYRPQTFGQLVGQEAIATTLSNALRQQRIAPAYLLCGPRGTGKTSSARILAKSLNCIAQNAPSPEPCGTCEVCRAIADGSALDFIEIDAASNTGVDNIRELIERAQFAPVQCRYKVYVIDECHMLSTAAFNALLKTLEEPPERVVFVLATTDPQRVLPTIISRCQRFDYRRIPLEPMIDHLQKIAEEEAIAIAPEALRLVAQISQGGLRDAQSLLDQLSLLEPPVTPEKVWDLVGAVPEQDLLTLVQAIAHDDGPQVLEQARKLMDRGREPLIVLQSLAGFYRDLLIAKTAGDRHNLVAVTPPTWADMRTLAQSLESGIILAAQQHLRGAELQVKNTTQPRLWLEVTLMGLLPSSLTAQMIPPPQSEAMGRSTAAISNQNVSSPSAVPLKGSPPLNGNSKPSPAFEPTPILRSEPKISQSPPNQAPHPPSNPAASSAAASPIQASPPQAAPPSPIQAAVPTAELQHLWQQVLGVLQPFGTRALMSQQGTLLNCEGVTARIGINSQPLMKMAQSRLPNVEAAFEQVVGHPVKVSLEVMPEAKTAASAETSASTHSLPSPTQPGSEAVNVLPTQLSPPAPSEPPPSPLVPGGESTPASSPTLPPEFPSQAPHEPSPMDGPIESEVSRAVKSFAQFFNGQIVDLGDDISTDRKSKFSGEPDQDVPF